MSGTISSFTAAGRTRYAKLNADGSPKDADFHVDVPGVTSLADLEALDTALLSVPQTRLLYFPAIDELQDWVLLASAAATADGIQRPHDFNSLTNAKVWFRKR